MADSLQTKGLQNVLRDEQRLPRVPEPGVVVIFGASGDLTSRKLVPALYELASQRKLPMEFAIVGISRTEMGHEEFRKKLRGTLEEHVSGGVSDDVWESFSSGIFYLSGDSKEPETYEELRGFLQELGPERGVGAGRGGACRGYVLPRSGATKEPGTDGGLGGFLKELDSERGTRGNRAFY